MFAHDQHHIFYVLAGDRIFRISLAALHAGYQRAVKLGMDGGTQPAGESPFAADTDIVELDTLLLLDDGEPREALPLDLASEVAMKLVVGDVHLTSAALLLWGDYCDETSARLDLGMEEEDAFRTACTGVEEGDAACE